MRASRQPLSMVRRRWLLSSAVRLVIAVVLLGQSRCAALMKLPFLRGTPVPSVSVRVSSTRAKSPIKPGSTLTLKKALSLALESNPDLEQGRGRVDEARAQVGLARSGHWPSLVAQVSYFRYLDPQRLLPFRGQAEVGVFTRNVAAGEIALTMPLFLGGKVVSEVRAARLLRLAAKHRLARSREETVFNVTSTYLAIIGQAKYIEALALAERALKQHRVHVAATVAQQKAAPLDLLRIDVRLADLRQLAIQARSTMTAQRLLLLSQIGLTGDASSFKIAEPEAFKAPARSTEKAIKRALRRRPDVQAARADLAARVREVDVALSGYWPSASLVGAYGFKTDLATSIEDVGYVGLSLQIPLFDGLATRAKVRTARARVRASAAALRKLRLQGRLEIQTAWAEINAARARLRATSLSIRQAEEALRLEREKHRVSRGTIADVLDAQAAALQAAATHLQAKVKLAVATARLRLAMGVIKP